MWSIWFVTAQIFILYNLAAESMPDKSPNYKISPKPCTGNLHEGTCMFVWECIRSEGQHIGMCVDTFMFGSCCAHNLTDNVILPETFTYNGPTKPFTIANNNKSKLPTTEILTPTTTTSSLLSSSSSSSALQLQSSSLPAATAATSNRPSYSSSATILHRPHGTGTLVIRPGNNQPTHQKPSYNAYSSTSVKTPSLSDNSVVVDPSLSSVNNNNNYINNNNKNATGLWNSQSFTSQWHVTTQPNFITKPKPPQTDKVYSSWYTKPKSTKKPIFSDMQTKPDYSTTIPKPQISAKPLPHTSNTSTTTTTTSTTTSTTTTTSTPTPTTTKQSNLIQSVGTIDRDTISAAKNVECGISSIGLRPETRIVGGKNAMFGRWPWQVSVRRTSFFGFSSTHRCGGAIINDNWIATAGHCVDDLLTSQIRIRVGEYDFSHVQEQLPYIERAVSKKIVHPKYNFFTYEYDLALVKLDFQIEFDPHISPICLPATDALLVGENATVTGWGRLSEGGTLPSVLQEVLVPIVSNDKCQTMFLQAGRHEFVPDIFLCAGHENGGQDSCQGDSGGPLQVKGKDGHFFLAGIISWGIGCAEANLPGVCTRISKFTQWILENAV